VSKNNTGSLPLRGILPVTMSNNKARSRTHQPPLSDTVLARSHRLFGHVCRADCIQDHSRALRACLRPAKEREYMKPGWPRHADMLRTVEGDLRSFTLGLASAYRRAQNKTAWHELVETATSKNMPQMMVLMLVLANAQDAG